MSSGKLNAPQRMVLEHLARYRLTFQEVVGTLFFDGGNPQKTLNQLREQGLIETQKGFGGNRAAYVLSRAGAAALGTSRRRADNLGSEALPANLAVLSFCLLRGRSRIRLTDDELVELFGELVPPGRFHCLERGARATRVYHVYTPGDSTRVGDVVARTRAHIAEVRKLPALEPWLRHELYSHAILVDNEDRAAALNAALDDSGSDGKGLRTLSPIHVESVAGLANLEEALRDLAQENQAA